MKIDYKRFKRIVTGKRKPNKALGKDVLTIKEGEDLLDALIRTKKLPKGTKVIRHKMR